MMLLLFSVGANAQNLQADSLTVKHRIKLNGYRLTGVSDDTTTANQDSSKVMTERAVKSMVLSRSASRDVQIAAKINYTDSSGMLAAYQAAINLRLKYADTASMLAAYKAALLAKLKYTDTASMLSAYQTALLARLKYTDTTGMLSAYQAAINLRLKYTDSAAMLAAYQSALNARQATLVSATNIKTINGSSILGSGNLTISPGISGTVAQGQIAYGAGSNNLSGNSKFYIDTANNGILHIGASGGSEVTTTTPSKIDLGNTATTVMGYYPKLILENATSAFSGIGSSNGQIYYTSQNAHTWYTGGSSPSSVMTLDNSGTLSITNNLNTGAGDLTNSGGITYMNTLNSHFLVTSTGSNTLMECLTSGKTLFYTSTDDGVNRVQINGTAKATAFNANSTQTTLSGGSSGSAIFSQPLQGVSLKKVIVYCNALNGATSTYTFPTAFTNTPAIVATNGLASSVVTTLTSSTMVVTGSTSTGIVILEGY